MIEVWIALSILSIVMVGAGLALVNVDNVGLELIGAAFVVALLARIDQAARYQTAEEREWRMN